MSACRAAFAPLRKSRAAGANAGWLLAYGLEAHDAENVKRRELFQDAAKALRSSAGIYRNAYERWEAGTPSGAGGRVAAVFQVKGRLAVGLGTEQVLETGVALHGTYGVPLIHGTALKGLASHYASKVWGAFDPKWGEGGESHVAVFGATSDQGMMRFDDAWMLPESVSRETSGLMMDVMTPHHSGYLGGTQAPTDFDDPNPVAFLSVAGRFRIVLTCEDESAAGMATAGVVLDLLTDALREWGVGGKTSSGYGRMVPVVPRG